MWKIHAIFITVVLLSAIYIHFEGRLSVGLALFICAVLFYVDKLQTQKSRYRVGSNSTQKNSKIEIIRKEKKSCCGNGRCSGKKNGVCCGSSSSGCCSSKSKGLPELGIPSFDDIKEPETTNTHTPVSIDFTESFKHNKRTKTSKKPKIFKKKEVVCSKPIEGLTVSKKALLESKIFVFYSSLQGSAKTAAEVIHNQIKGIEKLTHPPILLNVDELDDIDEYFLNVPSDDALYIMVVPSYDVDCPLDFFLQTLEENYYDFRIDKYPLKKLVGFSVMGIGDSESWPEKFCYQAKKLDRSLSKLGARRVFPLGEVCLKTMGNEKIKEWTSLLIKMLQDDEPLLYEYKEDQDQENGSEDEEVLDVEDLKYNEAEDDLNGPKQMVAMNSPTYKNLTKQGYKIVGSHSGVKICRWTKNELRGRGSCYKKSLFNIASSRCMELTPSLACSSKCVFCWRHGTNPVSKNWRWDVDQPEYILENALQSHYSMIKQMRGVPGVIAERFALAFQVRHCALSLVGEPIMYPYINRFVELLHAKGITSFLVCNAQHPEALENLGKVTQLYVSIDAPTQQDLKKVDRPLFKDYWQRMLQCLEILKTTQSHQRTVYRLTLVKSFNMSDISSYADLVEKGLPSFIEVKGATFSGSSDGNGNPLTMQNIPYYEECVNFVRALCNELKSRGLPYEAAAEHAHSNCLLIANTKYKINGEWYTHIDFDKFFELLNSGKQFDSMDYLSKTPEWALFGNGGFAPGNVRESHKERKLKNKLRREMELAAES